MVGKWLLMYFYGCSIKFGNGWKSFRKSPKLIKTPSIYNQLGNLTDVDATKLPS